MPSSIAAISVPGRLPMPPSTQTAKTRPIYSRPTEGSTGWMMMRKAPASDAVDADRVHRHQPQRQLILRHRHDGAADESARQNRLQHGDEKERNHERHQDAQRDVENAEVPRRPDIGRLDVAVVD